MLLIAAPFSEICIASWLPVRLRVRNLELIFNTKQHGYSLKFLYEKAHEQEPLLLVVRTTAGAVFGAFLSDCFRRKSKQYFGHGETFLFTFVGEKRRPFFWAKLDSETFLRSGTLAYKKGPEADLIPSMFISADQHYIIVGGGG